MFALLRADFIDRLTQNCFELEQLVLALATGKQIKHDFDELFRLTHSLKGAGGTHGFPLITSICHLLEDNLILCSKQQNFGSSFVTNSLALIDLMRMVASDDGSGSAKITDALEACRLAVHRNYCSVMVLDSSKVMPFLLDNLFATMPVQAVMLTDGLQALNRLLYESFDVLVISSNLLTLNGRAVISALKANAAVNAKTPILYYSSSGTLKAPELTGIKLFRKTPDLAKQLAAEILHISQQKHAG